MSSDHLVVTPESLPIGSPFDRFFDFDALSEISPLDPIPSPTLSSTTPGNPLTPAPSPPPSFGYPAKQSPAQWLDAQLLKQPEHMSNSAAQFDSNFSIDDLLRNIDPNALFNPRFTPQQETPWPNLMPSPADSQQALGAVDPQWFSTPSSMSPGPLKRIDEDESDGEDDDEEEEESPRESLVSKGKKAPAGGVTKRTSAVVAPKDKDADDWRPTPEEYKKMSSKEKRQLRNKISARNFRVRRKEYITTLESHIADRDQLIAAIRDELASSKKENVELKREVAALKSAVLEGRSDNTAGVAQGSPAPQARRVATPLTRANPYKDVGLSPGSGFWGGATSSGGITPVHATMLPEVGAGSLASTLAGKVATGAPFNINPLLNTPAMPAMPAHSAIGSQYSGFDAYADVNPFTIKTLDDYRMQLWTKLAREAGAMQAQREKDNLEPHPTLSSLAAALRPAFFYAEAREAARKAALKSGGLPTLPPTPAMVAKEEATTEALYAATLASQTLASRLGQAFWDAFSGASSPRSLDAKKVQAVLEGKAVVRVVDVETDATNALVEKMEAMSFRESAATREANRKIGPAHICAPARAVSGIFTSVQHAWREAPMVRR